MASNFFKIKNGENLQPVSGSTVTAQGDIAYNSSSNQVEVYTTGAESITTASNTQTFTNKTIAADGTGNSITNLANANIKSGAAIAVAKLASGSANQVLITDSGGTTTQWGTAPIAGGGTGVTSVTTSPTASAFAGWDANSNLSANNHIEGFRTQATANSTLTLTIADAFQQFFTGTTAGQVVKLPTTSVAAGGSYLIVNNSNQTIAVQSSGANAILTLAASSQGLFTALVTTPTTAANWSYSYSTANNSSLTTGTVTSVAASGPSGIATWSSAVTTAGTLTQTLSTQSAGTFLAGPTSGSAATPTFRALQVPTIQSFASGSGTYTTATGALYIRVRMVGAGGGGGGSGATATGGGTGGNTTFGSSLLTANGGTGGGTAGGSPGAGGSTTLNSPAIGTAKTGGAGGTGANVADGNAGGGSAGGTGAASFFGGGGSGGAFGGAGGVGATATGAGGGGASMANTSGSQWSSGGGGAGGYIEALIGSPSATYAYGVGAGGSAGGAGTSGYAGGAGATGYIEVTEYYQ